ncbi:MAG TPA: HepT-like ribonuclease domain-containing protein [Acetobacteraceae bacterium]|nr:HepT-like ribonuclease domain-containing protein [Acetobacteraceae bacterium]
MPADLVRPALRAILEAIDGIKVSTHDRTFDEFEAEWLLRHGVQRDIEIISEAARRIPPEIRATQPHIPWVQIIGIGNVLWHEYHRVSDRAVWNVVQDRLHELEAAIIAIEAALNEG